ncbi:hypothetical protein LAUMK7_01990 [Mycobacterium kansasii]|nr:hypothetical protein LAUMK40_02006 [Mycobacterium kansasii]VAZ73640.1 hypothetical protein LAUMK7_01990 [Mycobacterium kansasii]
MDLERVDGGFVELAGLVQSRPLLQHFDRGGGGLTQLGLVHLAGVDWQAQRAERLVQQFDAVLGRRGARALQARDVVELEFAVERHVRVPSVTRC